MIQNVSILILVDIGLVHKTKAFTLLMRLCLNPYSCGYRTGTIFTTLTQFSLPGLNPYSCGYRTGTSHFETVLYFSKLKIGF